MSYLIENNLKFGWVKTPEGIVKVQILKELEDGTYFVSFPQPTFERMNIPKDNVYEDAAGAAAAFNKAGGNIY